MESSPGEFLAEAVTEAVVQKLWMELIRDPDVNWPHTPFWVAIDLFGQATNAFSSNASLGAVILCRSTIEATCLTYLNASGPAESRGGGKLWRFGPFRAKGWDQIPWRQLKEAFLEAAPSLRGLAPSIDRIREDGDSSAHLMERILEALHTQVTGTSVKTGRRRDPWVGQGEAWRDIRDTREILRRASKSWFAGPGMTPR